MPQNYRVWRLDNSHPNEKESVHPVGNANGGAFMKTG
jgi:hypothetical protein